MTDEPLICLFLGLSSDLLIDSYLRSSVEINCSDPALNLYFRLLKLAKRGRAGGREEGNSTFEGKIIKSVLLSHRFLLNHLGPLFFES